MICRGAGWDAVQELGCLLLRVEVEENDETGEVVVRELFEI